MDPIVEFQQMLNDARKSRKSMTEYSCLDSNEERIKFTLRLFHELRWAPSIYVEGKSATQSELFKDKCNGLLKWPKTNKIGLNGAIELATTAIIYAPLDSKELSLAYACRSAALFEATLYNYCLEDIDRALKLCCPDEIKAEIYARKARCLMRLNPNPTAESEQALKKARNWLEKMDSNNPDKKIILKNLRKPNKMTLKEEPRQILNDKRNMPEIPNDNPRIPGASSAVEIKYSREFGRHIVATRDIVPGELLAVEEAYITMVRQRKRYTHCENCLTQTLAGIPCDYCVIVIYCSQACKEAAWNNSHAIDCQIISPMTSLQMDDAAKSTLKLTLKALKEAGTMHALKKMVEDIESTAGKEILLFFFKFITTMW